MPITKSAKKAARQNKRRRKKNTAKMKELRSLLKKEGVLISEKKTEEAKKLIPKIYKLLDKAVKGGLIKKNTAARRKSKAIKLTAKNK